MEIILGTKNINKIKEIKPFFKDTDITINSLPETLNLEVIEDGKTLLENANKKALAYAKALNKPVLSDDTGLFIKSLNNEPGINSHRYSMVNDLENNKKVLKELGNNENRDAYFLTVITLAFPNGKTFNYDGIFKGTIALEVDDFEGFGYDPIFIPLGEKKVVTKLDSNYKYKHSHRSKALLKLIKDLPNIVKYNNSL